jgi:hypothetical protein
MGVQEQGFLWQQGFVVDRCGQVGATRRAADLADAMAALGITPQPETFTSLLHACAQAREVRAHAIILA